MLSNDNLNIPISQVKSCHDRSVRSVVFIGMTLIWDQVTS